jgi:hypothetical protein
MTAGILSDLLYLACVVGLPAAFISALAYAFARRRAVCWFAYSMLLLSCLCAFAIPTFLSWSNPYLGSLTWNDVFGTWVSWMPVFVLSGAFVWSCVKGTTPASRIPLRVVLGTVLALPLGFLIGLTVH